MAKQILPRATATGGVERHAYQQHTGLSARRLRAGSGAWGARLGAVLLLFCAGATVAAQDRVLLYQPSDRVGSIRDFEITDGGRRWSLVRSVSLPRYCLRSRPVALADGSRMVWLAHDCLRFPAEPLFLLQYEVATGRASIINIGGFDGNAILVADPSTPRVFVIEPTRIIAIDDRLRVTVIPLTGSILPSNADAAGRYLAIYRGVDQGRDVPSVFEAVVIDTQTTAVLRTMPLQGPGSLQVSREGKLYIQVHSPCVRTPCDVPWLEARSIETGELLARIRHAGLHDIDEIRGVVLTWGDSRLVGRDLRTLVPLGEIRISNSGFIRWNLQVQQTRQERAILVYGEDAWSFFCVGRIDVFDGDTFVPIKSVDTGGCSYMLAVPPR